MAEDFQLAEKDREFVARILNEFARDCKNFPNAGVPEAAVLFHHAAERASGIAQQINPVIRDRSGLILRLKYPIE